MGTVVHILSLFVRILAQPLDKRTTNFVLGNENEYVKEFQRKV